MKIFEKIKSPNGRRRIYFCGIKICSYKRNKSVEQQKNGRTIPITKIYNAKDPHIKKLHQLNSSCKKSQIWFDHLLGGGTEFYFLQKLATLRRDTLLIRIQNKKTNYYFLTYYLKEVEVQLIIDNSTVLLQILKELNTKKIIINNLAHYNNVIEILNITEQLKKEATQVIYMGHDYQAIDKNITMLDKNNRYCEAINLDKQTFAAWNYFFTEIADELVAFSQSTIDIFSKLYPQTAPKCVLIPHNVPFLRKTKVKHHNTINIGVLGSIHNHKGAAIIQEMDALIDSSSNIKIKIIGWYSLPMPKNTNIEVLGKYNRENLPEIIEKNEIDIIFISSIWPETFSYTTSEAMLMDVPVACFNLGASPERVSHYYRGLVVSEICAKTALSEITNFARRIQNKNNYQLKKDMLLPYFDEKYYLLSNQDSTKAKIDPKMHFVKYGIKEGRQPFANFPSDLIETELHKQNYVCEDKSFDVLFYLKTYYSVAEDFIFSGLDPYKHYLSVGEKSGYVKNGSLIEIIKVENTIENVKFSIVIPVYNSAEYLENCLNSAYKQSVKNLEIIIVNDGSQDNSQDIIDRYAKQYPDNTKVIVHEENQGLVRTHTDGTNAVTGDYFAILDGDDWLDEYFCEKMGQLALAYDADAVCCLWTRPSEYKNFSIITDTFEDLRLLKGDIKQEAIGNWGQYPNIHYGLNRKLHKTEAWNTVKPIDLPKDVLHFEDHYITIKFLSNCTKVITIKNKLYNWFCNTQSISFSGISKKIIDNSFSVINSLSLSSDNLSSETLERNINNIFLKELTKRFTQATKETHSDTRQHIEYFAKLYDENRDKFTKEQNKKITDLLISIYPELCSNLPVEDCVFFLENYGTLDIKDSLLQYWSEHSNIPFVYARNAAFSTLTERLDFIRHGNTSKIIVATGGWGKDFINKRPHAQLWHGMGALKKVTPFPKHLSPDLAFCSSSHELVMNTFSDLFSTSKSNLLPYGSIMADMCFDTQFINLQQEQFFNSNPSLRGKKIYLWAPTFRGQFPNIFMHETLDFAILSEKLDENEVLLVKLHPRVKELAADFSEISEYSNIIDVTEQGNILQFLSVSSAFMTDYSSSIHYALLMNKPVCFLATDIDQYSKEQGLLINYRKDMPGEICEENKPEEILNLLRNAQANTPKYANFKQIHLGACDGHSRKHIMNAIIKFYHEVK